MGDGGGGAANSLFANSLRGGHGYWGRRARGALRRWSPSHIYYFISSELEARPARVRMRACVRTYA